MLLSLLVMDVVNSVVERCRIALSAGTWSDYVWDEVLHWFGCALSRRRSLRRLGPALCIPRFTEPTAHTRISHHSRLTLEVFSPRGCTGIEQQLREQYTYQKSQVLYAPGISVYTTPHIHRNPINKTTTHVHPTSPPFPPPHTQPTQPPPPKQSTQN